MTTLIQVPSDALKVHYVREHVQFQIAGMRVRRRPSSLVSRRSDISTLSSIVPSKLNAGSASCTPPYLWRYSEPLVLSDSACAEC